MSELATSKEVQSLIKKGVVAEDEQILFFTRQKRTRNLIHPFSLVVTDRQVIILRPKLFGYNADSHGYGLIQDVKVSEGLFRGSLMFKSVTGSVLLDGLPKGAATAANKAIRLSIAKRKKPG